MQLIQHRVNKIGDLKNITDLNLGFEIDLRSDVSIPGEVILSHDPWVEADSLVEWLTVYAEKKFRGTIILNTKEDGLESRVLEILNQTGVANFFFLDTTLPTLVNWTKRKKKKFFAVRHSKYESLQSAMEFKGDASWVWVDCFQGELPKLQDIKSLSECFNVCLVSPELQGLPKEEIVKFLTLKPYCHSICTKFPELWSQSSPKTN